MNANHSFPSWKAALGLEIRAARQRARLSQGELGASIKKSRQIIGRYESGSDAPSLMVLGQIAVALQMSEINVNGYRFVVEPRIEPVRADSTAQLPLELDREYISPGATLKITPGRVSITITSMTPLAAHGTK